MKQEGYKGADGEMYKSKDLANQSLVNDAVNEYLQFGDQRDLYETLKGIYG